MNRNFSATWQFMLKMIMENGKVVSPRGRRTKEVLNSVLTTDMRRPVLMVDKRKLSYQFMAAEAFWILTGDDKVETIGPWNKHITQFSDDGFKFFGAYGPKVMGQMDYVVNALRNDPSTRQAGLTIWRENPPQTKDVPCTVSLFFSLREGKLNCHAFMRSSDIWLGIPYDVFNFSMVAHHVCGQYNEGRREGFIEPGLLYLTAVSSHLYEDNWEQAVECLHDEPVMAQPTPMQLFNDTKTLIPLLGFLRDTKSGDYRRWWA